MLNKILQEQKYSKKGEKKLPHRQYSSSFSSSRKSWCKINHQIEGFASHKA